MFSVANALVDRNLGDVSDREDTDRQIRKRCRVVTAGKWTGLARAEFDAGFPPYATSDSFVRWSQPRSVKYTGTGLLVVASLRPLTILV